MGGDCCQKWTTIKSYINQLKDTSCIPGPYDFSVGAYIPLSELEHTTF